MRSNVVVTRGVDVEGVQAACSMARELLVMVLSSEPCNDKKKQKNKPPKPQ